MSDLQLDPAKDIDVDIHELERELRMYPLLFHRYLEKKVIAEHEYERAKENYKSVSASVGYRKKISEAKITEKTLASYVQIDPSVVKAKETELEAKLKFEKIKAYCEAFRAKKDSLVNLSANQRVEKN